jgi:Putative auto-transporter adhesin, head GIN domain
MFSILAVVALFGFFLWYAQRGRPSDPAASPEVEINRHVSKRLGLIAASGIILSVVCLASAVAVGGKTVGESLLNLSDWGGGPSCDVTPSGRTETRSLGWDGSDRASIAIPANASYRPGSGDKLVITGDSALLPHVRVHHGDVEFDCHMHDDHAPLTVTLPGRPFRGFSVAGSGNLALDAIDQDKLKINLAGSGDITANGKVHELQMNLAGSSRAKMGSLTADKVDLNIAGEGDVEVAPKDNLDVKVAGSGKVVLLSEPHNIESHIFGSGQIIHAAQASHESL